MAKVMDVAKYLINQSRPGTQENITNLKLQKLLYYAQGFNLAIKEKALFEEDIEAWVHGPVVPEVYSEFKDYTYNDINGIYDEKEIVLTKEEIDLLDNMWNIFQSYSGKVLEEMTHNEEPWINARNGLGVLDYSNHVIEKTIIQQYFKKEYIVQAN
ncbi:Panacea domain-containing protein [Bacillus cereus]